jgi:hypothetical protein
MLAISRTANVSGRIIWLVTSIITMKFIRALGVPRGVRWTMVLAKEFKVAFTIIDAQNDSLKQNVIEIWAVIVKLKGTIAIVFRVKMIINIEVIRLISLLVCVSFVSCLISFPMLLTVAVTLISFLGDGFIVMLVKISRGAMISAHAVEL